MTDEIIFCDTNTYIVKEEKVAIIQWAIFLKCIFILWVCVCKTVFSSFDRARFYFYAETRQTTQINFQLS